MNNCYIIDFNSIGNDSLGYLVALEENNNIPFYIKRVYSLAVQVSFSQSFTIAKVSSLQ